MIPPATCMRSVAGRTNGQDEASHGVQIIEDEGAEPPNFIRRLEKIRYHDGHHAGRGCRPDSVVGVLQGQQRRGSTPRRLAAFRYGSGAGLPAA